MNGLPPIMKKGYWNRDITFSSFVYKGEEITIDTEEKYLYWNERFMNPSSEEVSWFLKNDFSNLGYLSLALEDFLYATHRTDDEMFNR